MRYENPELIEQFRKELLDNRSIKMEDEEGDLLIPLPNDFVYPSITLYENPDGEVQACIELIGNGDCIFCKFDNVTTLFPIFPRVNIPVPSFQVTNYFIRSGNNYINLYDKDYFEQNRIKLNISYSGVGSSFIDLQIPKGESVILLSPLTPTEDFSGSTYSDFRELRLAFLHELGHVIAGAELSSDSLPVNERNANAVLLILVRHLEKNIPNLFGDRDGLLQWVQSQLKGYDDASLESNRPGFSRAKRILARKG